MAIPFALVAGLVVVVGLSQRLFGAVAGIVIVCLTWWYLARQSSARMTVGTGFHIVAGVVALFPVVVLLPLALDGGPSTLVELVGAVLFTLVALFAALLVAIFGSTIRSHR